MMYKDLALCTLDEEALKEVIFSNNYFSANTIDQCYTLKTYAFNSVLF